MSAILKSNMTDDEIAKMIGVLSNNMTEEDRVSIAQSVGDIEYSMMEVGGTAATLVSVVRELARYYVDKYEMDPVTDIIPARALLWQIVAEKGDEKPGWYDEEFFNSLFPDGE